MENDVRANLHQHIVSTWLNGDDRGFDDELDLQRSGILDSFSTLSLVAFIEQAFGIQLDPIDINTDTFKSIKTIADLVSTKHRATPGAVHWEG